MKNNTIVPPAIKITDNNASIVVFVGINEMGRFCASATLFLLYSKQIPQAIRPTGIKKMPRSNPKKALITIALALNIIIQANVMSHNFIVDNCAIPLSYLAIRQCLARTHQYSGTANWSPGSIHIFPAAACISCHLEPSPLL